MPQLNQSNLLTLHEIYTRTELWKDKIYYISNNPYKFPKNNGQGDFLPLPKRFASILTEFKDAIQKRKEAERPENERQEAQEQINEIYKEIKQIIKDQIEEVKNFETEIDEDDLKEEQQKQEAVQQVIKDIQTFFKNGLALVKEMPNKRLYEEKDLIPFLKETSYEKFKSWGTIYKEEIIEGEGDEPSEGKEIDLLEAWEDLNEGKPPTKNTRNS